MSLNLTAYGPRLATTRLLNCAGSGIRPIVRTVNSRLPSSTRPPGTSMFCTRTAVATSTAETLNARILSGLTQTSTSRCRPPTISTLPTPLIDSISRLICLSAMSVTSRSERGTETAMRKTGVASVSSFRKIVDDEIDFVAHFLRRHVSVLFQHEGDEDLRDALDRSRTQLVDSADGIDRAFDLVGDFGFNLLRRRAGIDYGHGNRRQIDLRKQIDAQ